LVIAGYRSRPDAKAIASATLVGSTYAVHWASGRWADAGTSVGVIARGMRVGLPALKTGRTLFALGSIAGSAGGAALIGAGQFRHRYACAQRDGRLLPQLLREIPGVTERPIHLYGHSLGTVVIRAALESLDEHRYRIEDIVLMGGMASRRGWEPLAERFAGRLINLYSPRDSILSIAPVWDRLVGTGEVQPACEKTLPTTRVLNHNVCRMLPNPLNALAHHSGYWRQFANYLS
jgi:pimeloyl-ACP methyl ester carboxylesterase